MLGRKESVCQKEIIYIFARRDLENERFEIGAR